MSDAAREPLALAATEADVTSLAAATRLRAVCSPPQAAAVASQVALRRRARARMGPRAETFFWTPDGLEQATRPAVSARRAARLAGLGVRRVLDLGCGLGVDAAALVDAGLAVTAVERDEATAVLAAANVPGARIVVGDAEALAPDLLGETDAVFCDPARRTAAGRSWRVEDLSPSWSFVEGLLAADRPTVVKVGPGLPLSLVAPPWEAEWVSEGGSVVECALWSGPGSNPGRRRAVVNGVELTRDAALAPPPVTDLDGWLYEPDGAVIRAGLVPEVARLVRGSRVDDQVAYLTAPWHHPTDFATAFEVLEVLPFDERVLRRWVAERGVGVLEIKKRGVEVDPAELRKRLRPRGKASATLIVTPTSVGVRAVVVRRAV